MYVYVRITGWDEAVSSNYKYTPDSRLFFSYNLRRMCRTRHSDSFMLPGDWTIVWFWMIILTVGSATFFFHSVRASTMSVKLSFGGGWRRSWSSLFIIEMMKMRRIVSLRMWINRYEPRVSARATIGNCGKWNYLTDHSFNQDNAVRARFFNVSGGIQTLQWVSFLSVKRYLKISLYSKIRVGLKLLIHSVKVLHQSCECQSGMN